VTIDSHISIGDLVVIIGILGSIAANYFGVLNKIRATDWKVEELRRGRGLILEHWPHAVRRCFGYDNGPTAQR
jgi:hypothetical protein